jgi:exodeoxyribonuclease VII large subunit
MDACRRSGTLPDAVVIIRGGGAVNDLAWLNDYELARCICELDVPVFTGIGHERDNTVLDEVAHTRFDTPSKVILGIEKLILRRVQEAKAFYVEIMEVSRQTAHDARRAVEQADRSVRDLSLRQVSEARERCRAHLGTVQRESQRSLRRAAQDSQEAFAQVGRRALAQLASGQAESAALFDSTLERARLDIGHAREALERGLGDVRSGARAQVQEGRERSQALVREITGQGPDKSLGRGFAIVRSGRRTVTSIQQIQNDQPLELQLRDGRVLTRATGIPTTSRSESDE